ncbi:jg6130 [Pararge aegeria aegeria]|uniref:Jg6130 protein n=1 Tax=Pararge aegeria aegeria TaxID=348720 RepID=A0A8S4QNQ2_9NEOP|nr:jg6130 [Pararge aegeria aegeria]
MGFPPGAMARPYSFLGRGVSETCGVRDRRRMFGLSYSSIDMARDIRRSTPGGGSDVSWLWPWQNRSRDCATLAGWNKIMPY